MSSDVFFITFSKTSAYSSNKSLVGGSMIVLYIKHLIMIAHYVKWIHRYNETEGYQHCNYNSTKQFNDLGLNDI